MDKEIYSLIKSTENEFMKMDAANGNLLDFEQQCMFAKQQIMKNDYTMKVASANQLSLKNAVCNVAAIGISLNPALSHAYLVPRDGTICLDISYRGLVKLATDCGAILWAKTELVYENDSYTWNGIDKMPTHEADPFSERGEVKGGYCVAKLPDGSVMVENMSRAEMDKIESTSKAKAGPWKQWPDEMRKKSVTKRASKSWPQTGNRERIDTAIEVLNQHEGASESEQQEAPFAAEELAEYQRCVKDLDFFNLAGLVASLGADAVHGGR